MTRGLSPKWVSWQARVFSKADNLAARFGGRTPPMPLAEIAREQRVHRFVFCEMPVDGGLVVEQDGFTIYVACDDTVAANCRAKMENRGDAGRSLAPRMRFTIAHEVIHTLFYDLGRQKPVRLISAKHRKELDSLERTCNQGAARLLIPDRFLEPALQDLKQCDADHLKGLCQEFRVSAEALVHRFEHSHLWLQRGIAVLVVEQAEAQSIIRGAAMDGPMKMLFPQAAFGEVASVIGHYPDLAVFGGCQNKLTVNISSKMASKAASQKCVISCSEVSESPRQFLITIQRIGEPRFLCERHGLP